MTSRRGFLKTAAAAGAAAAVSRLPITESSAASLRPAEGKKALFVYGGWDRHDPEGFKNLVVPWMEELGFEVTVSDSLDSYRDKSLMEAIDVVVQQWTMDKITNEQADGLLEAVRAGLGVAGWHGGLGDSFRDHTEYQFMVGGQWVSHPGGNIGYRVVITDHEDEITRGLSDFDVEDTEQYYMHVDPANKVLAVTTFTGEYASWIDGVVCPVIWKKMYGKGRVFYHSLGHATKDFDVPEVREITLRGILWAARSRQDGPEDLVRSVYGS